MKYLNYKQLAFVLDIPPIKALEKIISIHCTMKNIDKPRRCEKVNEYLFDFAMKNGEKIKVRNNMPEVMDIETLSEKLNLPTLQASVDDICANYLNRPATKKWILCDYPEKQLVNKTKNQIKIPEALRSMLPTEQINEIQKVWNQRFGIKIKQA